MFDVAQAAVEGALAAGVGEREMGLCEQVLDLVGARAEALVRAGGGQSSLTRFANSCIHQNVSEDTGAVQLHVTLSGGRTAAASTNRVDSDGLSKLVERALAAAALRPEDPEWPGLAEPAGLRGDDHWDDATAGATALARAGSVRPLSARARAWRRRATARRRG